jgi:transcriptional regulator with XRE-family HTH domain
MEYRIKELCKSAGLSIGALAEEVDMVRESLSRIINGGNTSTETLEKIAKALDVNIIELFKTESKPLCGFIEFEGITYKIDSLDSLKRLFSLVEGEMPVSDSPK